MLLQWIISKSHSYHWLALSHLYFFQCSYYMIIVPRLSYQSNLFSWCLYIYSLFMKYFYFIFILAILLILVHSFYSWDQNQKGDHLAASFQQFIKSTHPQVIASAVEQAIKSCGQNHDLVCEEIIRIVLKHSLGKLTF